MNVLIILASTATIGLMGAFARQNRKEGWVKARKTLIESLRQAKRDLMTIPEPATRASSVAYAGLPIDPTNFSRQLGLLQNSLHRANQPVIGAGRVNEGAGKKAVVA